MPGWDVCAVERSTIPLRSGVAVKDFFSSWAKNKSRETACSTGARYKRTASMFVDWLGEKADRDISALAPRDILAFRDHLASRLSASTAHPAVKIVRMALGDAQSASLVTANVATCIRSAKSLDALRVANDEWRNLILFGHYTGQRLGDIASLTWQSLDLARGELALVTRKTKKTRAHSARCPTGKTSCRHATNDDPKQPIFPKAFAHAKRTGTLSDQFYAVMADAGLVRPLNHTSIGKGRSNQRAFNELSFHALRHTATSLRIVSRRERSDESLISL